MNLWDLLYQASFWQWMGIIHLAWVCALAINGIGPLIKYVRQEDKKP